MLQSVTIQVIIASDRDSKYKNTKQGIKKRSHSIWTRRHR